MKKLFLPVLFVFILWGCNESAQIKDSGTDTVNHANAELDVMLALIIVTKTHI